MTGPVVNTHSDWPSGQHARLHVHMHVHTLAHTHHSFMHAPQQQQRGPLESPTSGLLSPSLMLLGDGAEFSDANDAMLDAKHPADSPARPPQRPLYEGGAGGWKGPSQQGHWSAGALPAPHYYNTYHAADTQPMAAHAPAPPPPPMPPGPAALRRRSLSRKSTHVKRDTHHRPHAAARTGSGALPPTTALLHSSSAPALGDQGPRPPPPWEVALPDADRVGDDADELLQESESDVSGMAARSSSRARRTKQQWASGRSSILKLEQELAELDTTVRTTLHQPVSELAGLANHSVANHVCIVVVA